MWEFKFGCLIEINKFKLYYHVISGSQYSADSDGQTGSDSDLKEINDFNCPNRDGIMDIEYQKQLTTITE